MATVSITIPDALVPRVVAAIRGGFPQYAGLTDAQAFKTITAEYWKAILANYESNVAYDAAHSKALTDAGGIGNSIP